MLVGYSSLEEILGSHLNEWDKKINKTQIEYIYIEQYHSISQKSYKILIGF